MSKYEALWKYLKDNDKDNYKLTFEEIVTITNFNIDHSFLKYKKEVTNYGYLVKKISLKEKFIEFNKL